MHQLQPAVATLDVRVRPGPPGVPERIAGDIGAFELATPPRVTGGEPSV
jgi:hypothetical protein